MGLVEPVPGSVGSVVLCSDGLAGSWPDWRPLAVELFGRARVYAVVRERTDLIGAAREVLAGIEEIGADRVRLVGHSMGGFIVEAAVRLVPERVEAITLLDGSLTPANPVITTVDRVLASLLERTSGRYAVLARLASELKPFGEPAGLRTDLVRRRLVDPIDSRPEFWRTVAAELVAYQQWAEDLEHLRPDHPLGAANNPIRVAVVTATNPPGRRWAERQARFAGELRADPGRPVVSHHVLRARHTLHLADAQTWAQWV